MNAVADARRRPRRLCLRGVWPRGISLIELLVVIAIIAILVSLLFPAIHAVRDASRRTACDNHFRQLELAMATYIDMNRGLPPAPEPDRTIGWSIAILPFMEEMSLADRFDPNAPPTAPQNVTVARYRPPLFVCPVTLPLGSTIMEVDETNFVLVVDRMEIRKAFKTLSWQFHHAPPESRFPWFISKELAPVETSYPRPHSSAFNLGG